MFTSDNTEGFKQFELDRMNKALELMLNISGKEDDDTRVQLEKHYSDKVCNRHFEGCNVLDLVGIEVNDQAEMTNRVFPGWFGDASEGESYINEWSTTATDKSGTEYEVVWHFEVVKGAEPESDAHDWDDIYSIRAK